MWKKLVPLVALVAASILLTPVDADARGGGRGGGSGGRGAGGAYRGGHTMNRTPTMSRAANMPTVSPARPAQPQRAAASTARGQQTRQAIQRASAVDRTDVGNRVSHFEQNRPALDSKSLAQRTRDFSSQRSSQLTQNRQLSDNVSQRLSQSRPGYNDLFNRSFFDAHHVGLDYVRNGVNWWKPVAWGALADYWSDWGWSSPYYYDYWGYAYPVTPVETAYSYPDNSTTPYQPAQNSQSSAKPTSDWLPLGVFAVASDINTVQQTNHFIQLAVNRQGEISGVLYNAATDSAYELIGMVDPKTQKAYWYMADKADAPVSSTGIYNLTEDQTPINVQFSDGTDQPWVLVRLQQEHKP